MPRFWVTVRRQRVVQETAELWIEAESEHAAEDIALVMEDEAGLDFKDSDDIPDWQNVEIEVLPDDAQIEEIRTEQNTTITVQNEAYSSLNMSRASPYHRTGPSRWQPPRNASPSPKRRPQRSACCRSAKSRPNPASRARSSTGPPSPTWRRPSARTVLLQPITVRQVGPDAFMIVAGERRYRASVINGGPTIRAIVIEPTDNADIRVKQIIENDQRVDVTPIEQGRSYQALMDDSGWTAEQFGSRIGKAAWRITERTNLMKLAPEHQALLESGNLKPSEATEMVRLSPRGQQALFNAIRTGRCTTFQDLRNAANALVAAEAQTSLLGDPEPETPEETAAVSRFEASIERVAAMLRAGIQDNQIVAVKKINPHRADHLADLMAAMQKDLRRIEMSLRTMAVQASLLDN